MNDLGLKSKQVNKCSYMCPHIMKVPSKVLYMVASYLVVLFSASRFWSIDNSIINHVHLLIILLVFLQIYIINLFHRR